MSPKKSDQNHSEEKIEKALEPAQKQLEEALKQIDTPEEAEAVAEELVDETAEQPAVEVAGEIAPVPDEEPPPEQARAAAKTIEEAAESEPTDVEAAAGVLEATAAEATALEGAAYEALAEEVQSVTAPVPEDRPSRLERQRRYLRDALKKYSGAGLLQAYDTDLFIFINNHTPRTVVTDTFFSQLSFWFRGGIAWFIGVALCWPFRREWTIRTLKLIALPIWVAGLIVEGPVKMFFRRRRPFVDVVRAIVVGKKPGN